MRVFIRLDDKDRHGAGCSCGLCNSNGHSYGASIVPEDGDEPLDRIYSPSEASALKEAEAEAIRQGHKVISEPELD